MKSLLSRIVEVFSGESLAPSSQEDLYKVGLDTCSPERILGQLCFEPGVKVFDTWCLGASEIGMLSFIGYGSEIKNASIGRYCSLAANVAIGPAEHPVDWVSSHPVQYSGTDWFDRIEAWHTARDKSSDFSGNRKRTNVGHDVWIGRNVVIRQGVSIGTGAIIGAGAFVNKNVAPYSVVGGVPAKPIRKRFDEDICERLLKSEWWDHILPDTVRAHYSNPVRFLDELERQKRLGNVRRHNVGWLCAKRGEGGLSLRVHQKSKPSPSI